MRIKKLSLSNFRSFGSEQVIDFAPITLLFGPNSVGKSSVLMAIFYIQQILEKGHCDPVRIDALGERDIGGFASLVNGKDLKKSITLKLECEVGNTIGKEYETFADWVPGYLDKLDMPNVADDTETFAIELEVAWSFLMNKAYVKRYTVALNGIFAGQIEADKGLKQAAITALNFTHPLLFPSNHEDWVIRSFEDGTSVHPSQLSEEQKASGDYLEEASGWHSAFHFEIDTSTPFVEGSVNIENIEHECKAISVKTFYGAVPPHGHILETNIVEPLRSVENTREGDEYLNKLVCHRVLTQIFVSPLDKVLEMLRKSVCIGPLRTIPGSSFVPNPHPVQSSWIDGTAAWDLLHRCNAELNEPVNRWLSGKNGFDSGYALASVVKKTYVEVKSDKSHDLDQMKEQLNNSIKSGKPDSDFDDMEFSEAALLYDQKKCITLAPNQVGCGISQIIPVVTAAHYVTDGLVAIEQPELHIHPAFQVEVGDLFTQLEVDPSRRPTFLIETHSEHLMLRILRRIRETTDKELRNSLQEVKPSDIAVIYLEAPDEEVVVRRIEIDEDGEFIQRWPKGFFGERRRELM